MAAADPHPAGRRPVSSSSPEPGTDNSAPTYRTGYGCPVWSRAWASPSTRLSPSTRSLPHRRYIDPVHTIGWTTKLLPGFASGVALVTVAVISSSVRAVPTV